MPFKRPSLTDLTDRIRADYRTRYRPLEPSLRYDLIDVLARIDAGIYHQMYGDLVFLSRQIFPDSAEDKYLREHWSDRVPPLYATKATGIVTFTGPNGVTVPAGTLLQATDRQTYFTDKQTVVAGGAGDARVTASDAGSAANLGADAKLTIISSLPAGIAETATVGAKGLAGGVDAESDATYLSRVLTHLRGGVRYGKPGDFAAWAVDSSTEVDRAWEFPNWSVFGALLIVVASGSQAKRLVAVANTDKVVQYIKKVAPPVLFEVRSPEFVPLNPTITLKPEEDTAANRATVETRIRNWMHVEVKPGKSITAGHIRGAFVDGVLITSGNVSLTANPLNTTQVQIAVIGTITWR